MEIKIRLAKPNDLDKYTDLLQRTYQHAYTDESIGLISDCFSKEIFATDNTQEYLKSNLIQNHKQKAWLAFVGKRLIGSITIINQEEKCQLRGFYVDPTYQGRGIGKRLWQKAINFSKDKDIILDTYAHNTKTIDIYKKLGFKIDKEKGVFFRNWPEWPKDLQAKCIYMRYTAE